LDLRSAGLSDVMIRAFARGTFQGRGNSRTVLRHFQLLGR
jgi:hypothetical protein